MARVILPCPPKPQLPYVFVVDRAVGEGCPNHRDDVLLVQFFLRTLISAGGRPLAVKRYMRERNDRIHQTLPGQWKGP